jgi:FMN phosphatase YigB (HAD superfamily)
MGVLGALISRGADHNDLWATLGVSRPESPVPSDRIYLYPDAISCLSTVRGAGLAVGVAGNQPNGTQALLQAAGVQADFIASSAEWGLAKPDSRFFERLVDESGVAANAVLYVGDRLDNDILPARSRGMRTAFLRRGRWGHIHSTRAEAALADMHLKSLDDLAEALQAKKRVGETIVR